MRHTFHLKALTLAVAALSTAGMANAAGLDRSGQDITAFLQDGLYAEASYTYIDADVTGKDSANNVPTSNAYAEGRDVGDIAESYDFFRYGVKADLNDTFSIGILYDEPFGAAAKYSGDNNFVAQDDLDATISAVSGGIIGANSPIGVTSFVQAQGTVNALQNIVANGGTLSPAQQAALEQLAPVVAITQAEFDTAGEGTNVEVRSESVTAILGAKFGAKKQFQVYGGPVAQRVDADVKLRGTAYGPATGYTSRISPDQDYGYLAGISYSKPEIALKAALTYRSEIDHNMQIFETYPTAPVLSAGRLPASKGDTIDITTPESINFDFQTGLNPTTLATAKVRWVPWGDFSITPPLYTDVSKSRFPDGLALVDYEDDQWLVELGLAKRLTPALAVSGNVSWDSGAGDPTTSLGPVDGYYGVGLGAKYNVTENWAVSAGGKYLWFGDAQGQLPSDKIVGNFEDNDGYVVGVKLSYQAKQGF